MPLDFKRPKGAQLSARKTAQMKMAMKNSRLRPSQIDEILEGLLPYMNEETTTEEVVDLAETAAKLAEQLGGAVSLADALKAALQEVATEEDLDDSADPEAKGTTKARVSSAMGAFMLNKLYDGDPMRGSIMHRRSEPAKLPEMLSDALYARMTGKAPRIGAKYAGASLPEMAELCLRAAGRSSGTGSWLGGRGGQAVMSALHSTSDFPLILGNTVNRLMLETYESAQSGLKLASRVRQVVDFRAVKGLRASGSLEFTKVNEGGEFTYGTVEEAGETVVAATFGKVLGLTQQAIVNDDLGAFEYILRMLGEGAAQCEGKAFAGLINANAGAGPTMSDSQPLFHTSHGNIAGTAAALSVTSLNVARTAMRRQKDLAGAPINVTPVYLIVPPEQEAAAEKVLAEITAMEVGEVNPFSGKLTLIVDAYLTSTTRWYLAAAPGRPEGLTHVYLDGAARPQIFTQEGFDVDGMKFKGRLDFGCAFMDWRGWFMNPGA